jgi:hypothetical protein
MLGKAKPGMRASALAELHEIFLGQGGGAPLALTQCEFAISQKAESISGSSF